MRRNLGWATVPVALTLAGCAAAAPPAAPKPSPTPVSAAELVSWVDAACGVRDAFAAFWNSSAADYQRLKASGDQSGTEAWTYVSARSRELQTLASRLGDLPPVNAPAPTAWRSALRDTLIAPKAQLAALDNGATPGVTPVPELIGRADQAATVIAKLALPKPDLASADPALTVAYAQAPRCTPPKPAPTTTTAAPPAAPPPAKDGENVAACADGQCEVKVANQVRIPVFELKLTVKFAGGVVTVSTSFPGGGGGTFTIGEGGAARVGRPDGSEIALTFKGVNADAAVVEVTTK